jgi:hypothetical protein
MLFQATAAVRMLSTRGIIAICKVITIIVNSVIANFYFQWIATVIGAIAGILTAIADPVTANWDRTINGAIVAIFFTLAESVSAAVAGPTIRTLGAFLHRMTDAVAASFKASATAAAGGPAYAILRAT